MKRSVKRMFILLSVLAVFLAVFPAAGPPPGPQVAAEIVADGGWDDGLVNWHTSSLPADQVKAVYRTPEGVQFVSYSPFWDEERLKELHDIFSQMLVGNEIRYLSKIIISNELSLFTQGAYFPAYYRYGDRYELAPGRVIVLYKDFRSTEAIASTLAHEYGHHFTHYWITKKEGKWPDDPNTGWAKLRDLSDYPVVWADSGLEKTHKWMPQEIMADEYAVLFGPPALRNALVGKNETSLIGRVENDLIPLPDNDPRIRDYWLNLSDLEASPLEPLKPPVITSIQAIKHPYAYKWDYLVEFEPATDDPDRQKRIQYFVRWKHAIFDGQSVPETGVTRVLYSRYTSDQRNPNFEEPRWKGYFAVYAFDRETGQFVKSDPVWFDMTNPDQPVPLQDPYDPSRTTLQIVFGKGEDFSDS